LLGSLSLRLPCETRHRLQHNSIRVNAFGEQMGLTTRPGGKVQLRNLNSSRTLKRVPSAPFCKSRLELRMKRVPRSSCVRPQEGIATEHTESTEVRDRITGFTGSTGLKRVVESKAELRPIPISLSFCQSYCPVFSVFSVPSVATSSCDAVYRVALVLLRMRTKTNNR